MEKLIDYYGTATHYIHNMLYNSVKCMYTEELLLAIHIKYGKTVDKKKCMEDPIPKSFYTFTSYSYNMKNKEIGMM